MIINKDTMLYGSFSANPGNGGATFFNNAFQAHDINAIYKPFKCEKFEDAIHAMKTLNIKGVGVSMPFKFKAFNISNYHDPASEKTRVANTLILNDDLSISSFNTDYYAINSLLSEHIFMTQNTKIIILGSGAFATTVLFVCADNNMEYKVLERNTFNEALGYENAVLFNCTPANLMHLFNPNIHLSFIDCRAHTKYGKILADLQARKQFKIYTGIDL